jgi:hypothetical protein
MQDELKSTSHPRNPAPGSHWSTLRTLFVELLADRAVQA